MSPPVRPVAPANGFEDLIPKPTAAAPSTATGFDDLIPHTSASSSASASAPRKNTPVASSMGKPEDEPGVVDEIKTFGRNLTSVEGLKKIGKGAYHGVIDPLATTSVMIGGSPDEIEREVEHSKAQLAKPSDPWYRPQVATTPNEQAGAMLSTAVAALPVGEGVAQGGEKLLAKVAPSAAERVAELLGSKTAGGLAARAGKAAVEGATHGAAIGAASNPEKPGTSATLGAMIGAAGGAIGAPVAEKVSDVAAPAVAAVGDRVKAAKIVPPESMADLHELVQDPRGYVVKKYDEAQDAARAFDQQQEAAAAQRAATRQPATATQQRQLPATTDHAPDFEVEQNPAPAAPTKPAPPEIPLEDLITHMDDRIKALLEQRDVARREAETDPLTGLGNRAALDRALPNAEAHPRTSVVAFDANNFGKINKTAGQAAGDAAITELGAALHTAAQEHGGQIRIFRRGGDEFVALAPKELAESFRQRAEQLYGDRQYGEHTVSLSGHTGDTFADADAGLQAAKAARKTAAATAGSPQEPRSGAAAPSVQPEPPAPASAAPEGFEDLVEGAGGDVTKNTPAPPESVKPDTAPAEPATPEEDPEGSELADLADLHPHPKFKKLVAGRTLAPSARAYLTKLHTAHAAMMAELKAKGIEIDAGEKGYHRNLTHALTLPDAEAPDAASSAREELEREHAELLTEHQAIQSASRATIPTAERITRQAPLERRMDAVRAELAQQGVQVQDWRDANRALKEKRKDRGVATRDLITKPPTKPDAELHASARALDGERFRPYHTVSVQGLVDEMASLRDRIANRTPDAEYRRTENDRLETITVATRKGNGPSLQAKALTNINDWTRRLEEITQHLEATRGLTREEIDELETQAIIRHFDEISRQQELEKRGIEGASDEPPEEHELEGTEPVPFEVGPKYGLHGPVEPVHASLAVPEWRRRALPDAPLERTVATSNYPNAGGEAVRVHQGTSVAHGDIDPEKMDRDALFGRGRGGYWTDHPDVAGGIVAPDVVRQFGVYNTRAEAEAVLARQRALQGEDTADNITRYELVARADGKFSVNARSHEVVKRGYAHKGHPDEAYLLKKIRDTQDELARWHAHDTPEWKEALAMDREFTPEERAEAIAQLKRLEQQTEEHLRSLHESLEKARGRAAPNVRVARLAVFRPFDADAPIEEDRTHGVDALERIMDAARELYPEHDWDYAQEQIDKLFEYQNPSGEQVYRILQHTLDVEGEQLGPTPVNTILEHAGYDAITHLGGGRTNGVEHRVWIPFHRESVLSAFGDPQSAYMVGEPHPEYHGAHYRQQLAARAQQLPKDDAAQLELAFGSPEQGLAAVDRVVQLGGKLATVSYAVPLKGRVLSARLRAENVAKGAAEHERAVTGAHVALRGKIVRSADVLAKVMRIGRDPRMEHLQIAGYNDESELVHYGRWTSGSVNYVQLSAAERAAIVRELYDHGGITHVDLTHNHPSGAVKASTQDLGFTTFLQHELDEEALRRRVMPIKLRWHVIIDHTEFTLLTRNRDLGAGALRVQHPETKALLTLPAVREQRFQLDPKEFAATDWTHSFGAEINSPESLSAMLAALVRDGQGIDVLHFDTRNRVLAHEFVPVTGHDAAQMARAIDKIAASAKTTAANSVVLVTSHSTRQWSELAGQANLAMRAGRLDVLDALHVPPDRPVLSALGAGLLEKAPDPRTSELRAGWRTAEPSGQLGMFGDLIPAPAPKKSDQLGMFGELEGTKLAQDEAKKLANKDEKISAAELAQRRDELAPATSPAIKTGEDQGALFDVGDTPGPLDATLRENPIEFARELHDSFRRAFDPAARGDLAKDTARIVRRETGMHAREIEQATEAAKAASRMFKKMPRAEQLAFIDNMERGQPQATPELDAIAKVFRTALDNARTAVQQLGTGKLQSWIENYFPHIWKNPKKAGIFFGKRPMEGSKSFLKHREIPTVADGIAAGLEPLTTNPADLTVLKLREMHRYILAWRILNDLQQQKIAKWISVRRKPPEGWVMIDDRVATKYGPPTVTVAHFEAFDSTMREGLVQAMKALGVTHRRTVTDPEARTALGYARMKGPGAGVDMWTRFGGDVGTIIHELGHLLDARHGLWDHLIDKPKKKLNNKGKNVSADTKEEIQKRKELNAELRALADMRYTGQPPKSYVKYVRNREEKIANAIQAMLSAPELAARVAPTVTSRLRAFFAARPELEPLLHLERGVRRDTDARVKEYDTGGVVIRAKLYAPEAAARVVNNYLSPGLRGSPWYNAYMGVGNLLNAAQLGLSAFHLGFTSLDASVSKGALALEQALHGEPVKALGSAALVPAAPFTNIVKGNKVLREYLHPGTQGAAFGELADAVARAGGRVRMDEWYRVGQLAAMKDAMKDALHGARWTDRAAGAGEVWLRALPAALELAAKPLMEYVVPRQKLGVFADLARHELDRLARAHPTGAPVADVEAALQRAWDSVDNRMGQMVYDNLFWHKIGKDLAHAAMRSVGWNIGTVRELVGGAADATKAGGELAKRATGKGSSSRSASEPLFTHRMAYLVALPVVVGLYGALLQYLYTGHGPESLRDLYYPRTGKTTPEGDEERLELPSYMKDVGAVSRHPVTTVEHKLSPMLDLVTSMLHNEDYYGDEIYNPDDPSWKQAEQGAAYVGKSFTPFSLQGALEEGKRGGTPVSRALSMVGVTPAPREVTRTPLQQGAVDIASRRAQGIQTPEERDRTRAKQDLVRREREGENVSPELGAGLADGELSVADVRRLRKAGLTDGEARRFAQMSLEDMRTLLEKATPEERAALGPLIAKKMRAARQRHALPAGFTPP